MGEAAVCHWLMESFSVELMALTIAVVAAVAPIKPGIACLSCSNDFFILDFLHLGTLLLLNLFLSSVFFLGGGISWVGTHVTAHDLGIVSSPYFS